MFIEQKAQRTASLQRSEIFVNTLRS